MLDFIHNDPSFKNRYLSTSKLYYNGQPDFEEVLARIKTYLPKF